MSSDAVSQFRAMYVGFERVLAAGRSSLLLLVRLYWGWQFAQNGWGKLHSLSHVTQYFNTLHIPAPALNAVAIALLEFCGGLFLILGIGSRAIGALLAADMMVAFVLADGDALKMAFSDPGKLYAADPFTFLCASILIAVLGAGAISLDYLLAGRREVGCGENAVPSE